MPVRTRVTAASIARHLGISKSTVTHVLNGRAEAQRIAVETQTRVQEAAQELGYRPNGIARAMGTGRFNSIALLQPVTALSTSPALTACIATAIRDRDNNLLLAELPFPEGDSVPDLPRVIREVTVDGLLIHSAAELTSGCLALLDKLATPIVWLHRKHPVNSVHVDDAAAGYMATDQLLRLGHQEIVFLTGSDGANGVRTLNRRRGFQAAVEAAGIHGVHMEYPADAASHSTAQRNRAESVLQAVRRFTAVVVDDQFLALELALPKHNRGKHEAEVPSIILVNDEASPGLDGYITRVGADTRDLAKWAVTMLMQCVEAPTSKITSKCLQTQVFEGVTAAPPNSRLDLLPIGRKLQF